MELLEVKQSFLNFNMKFSILIVIIIGSIVPIVTVESLEAKDIDDSILYKIEFELPDVQDRTNPKNQIKTFYTQDKEKYDCLIPNLEETKRAINPNEQELSPLTLLKPVMNTHSYRIEPYWSYEVLHGHHVRQYHEEREGKVAKYQEYYLGKWNSAKMQQLQEEWLENHKTGIKYKTTKIDNVKYPYFEMSYTDGTMCDIIKSPRSTLVRYVCYPHGKNEIYSFKETSSCHYEVIILTSSLCALSAFVPEETKEVSIKCFNSPLPESKAMLRKPLSMLKQELNDMKISEEDIPIPKEISFLAGLNDRGIVLNKIGGDVDNFILNVVAATTGSEQQIDISEPPVDTTDVPKLIGTLPPAVMPSVTDLTFLLEFISGKNCFKGGSGWWKYEFCYGRYVRQYHNDKKSETEVHLGYFFPQLHSEWLKQNPHKRFNKKSSSLWHHYEKGSLCDQTGVPRSIDVKLTCRSAFLANPHSVSMYLLEPKTCHYILGFESPMVCELLDYVNEDGLIDVERLKQFKTVSKDTNKIQIIKMEDLAESPAEWSSTSSSAQERIEL